MFELKKVNKRFPGVHALKDIDFEIRKNEIVGLVGENGAGKSTLMKILYGAYSHDDGEILIEGNPVKFKNPRQAMQKGVGMVFQEQSLILNLSVMENIFLGFEKQFSRFGVLNRTEMAKAASFQLNKVKLGDMNPRKKTSDLSFAQRQLVELAKVLTLEERVNGDMVILLDEPTSVLAKEEIDLLFELVRDLRSRSSFIFISHRLDEILELSNRVYILKDGAVMDCVNAENADVESIQTKMVGTSVSEEFYGEEEQKSYEANKIVLKVENLNMGIKYRDVSFPLHAGEVMSLVGTEGSGCEEILRTIFGLEKADSGSFTTGNKKFTQLSSQEAVKQKIGYIPRERKIEGIAGGMTVYENLTLSQLESYATAGVIYPSKEKKLAREWIQRLSIKVPSENSDCGNLSGGNQQKVVLAKWHSTGCNIILLDHPTRGLDIGAKQDVYRLIREMSTQGIGVLLVADTLEEAIGLSHTVLAVKDGIIRKKLECLPGKKPSPYDILKHII